MIDYTVAGIIFGAYKYMKFSNKTGFRVEIPRHNFSRWNWLHFSKICLECGGSAVSAAISQLTAMYCGFRWYCCKIILHTLMENSPL